MRPLVGDDVKSRSPSSRPASTLAARGTLETNTEDLTKLSLNPGPEPATEDYSGAPAAPPSSSNPLKRAAAGESHFADQPTEGHAQRNRRAKALSGGSFLPKDPEFDRKAAVTRDQGLTNERHGSQKRLFDPNTDKITSGPSPRKLGKADTSLTSRRVYDQRSHLFRSPKGSPEDVGQYSKPSSTPHPTVGDHFQPKHGMPVEQPSYREPLVDQPDSDNSTETDPELLLQPETRPISHDQLVVEVKGIYAGLVMLEAKCIDVDEKQTVAAQEKDPSKQSKLTPEQWQALIALHKTLLHEHHDFFLASQHPSASPALSRLAAKYSMPARMWRHGIHAFLEVLRHRLPDSLDHMLAFIYIAYSMMALLYETVPTFEDTWIECLGDLGRYRMAIEDDDIRDREVWSGVARFWYGKAADKSPKVGRLYHHLAILAPAYTFQQLSLYTRSLTCTIPFESAKGSIMTLFIPVLEGKESAHHRSSSMEVIFIKAHGLLFTAGSMKEFVDCVQQLLGGLIDTYIGRVTAMFKEQGVFAALSNIASLFEYGALRARGGSRSSLRLAFEEVLAQGQTTNAHQNAETASSMETAAAPTVEPQTPRERDTSLRAINHALDLTFGTLAIALRRLGDKNVYPLVHVYLVFIYSIVDVEKAMRPLERGIPWSDLATFLTALAKPDAMNSKVLGEKFPKPVEGVGRPLPEDFLMRGQLWTECFFPNTWFLDAAIDDEERSLELPSMAAPRVERVLWLGHRIATYDRWLSYDPSSNSFTVTQHVKDLPPRDISQSGHLASSRDDADSVMSGLDEGEDEDASMPMPDSPPAKREPSLDLPGSDLDLGLSRKESPPKPSLAKSSAFAPKKILTKDDSVMSSPPRTSINADSEEWLKGSNYKQELMPQKPGLDRYLSDPRELEVINVLDVGSGDDSTKA
jgi:hypothetical protein